MAHRYKLWSPCTPPWQANAVVARSQHPPALAAHFPNRIGHFPTIGAIWRRPQPPRGAMCSAFFWEGSMPPAVGGGLARSLGMLGGGLGCVFCCLGGGGTQLPPPPQTAIHTAPQPPPVSAFPNSNTHPPPPPAGHTVPPPPTAVDTPPPPSTAVHAVMLLGGLCVLLLLLGGDCVHSCRGGGRFVLLLGGLYVMLLGGGGGCVWGRGDCVCCCWGVLLLWGFVAGDAHRPIIGEPPVTGLAPWSGWMHGRRCRIAVCRRVRRVQCNGPSISTDDINNMYLSLQTRQNPRRWGRGCGPVLRRAGGCQLQPDGCWEHLILDHGQASGTTAPR